MPTILKYEVRKNRKMIYTRTGDLGITSLYGGKRISKNDTIIEALGTVDELNANLGLVISTIKSSKTRFRDVASTFLLIQEDLMEMGFIISRCGQKTKENKIIDRKLEIRIKKLEEEIDLMEKELPGLHNFVLPGGCEISAQIHVVRTVCRRVERGLVTVCKMYNVECIKYLNRLGDYLFVLARWINFVSGNTEVLWKSSH